MRSAFVIVLGLLAVASALEYANERELLLQERNKVHDELFTEGNYTAPHNVVYHLLERLRDVHSRAREIGFELTTNDKEESELADFLLTVSEVNRKDCSTDIFDARRVVGRKFGKCPNIVAYLEYFRRWQMDECWSQACDITKIAPFVRNMTTAVKWNSIRKLLVANRGEIACRIMRTAKRMNIETMAIYSDIDKNSMHVKLADEAHCVGEAEPRKSYLNQDKIIELSKRRQVSAIHPGYGFLSENYEFSQRCNEEQLVFVGPSAESIRAMGIKNESKRIMIEAGVPVVPGYHGLDQADELPMEEARKIGFPVLIKPVRGGGGKGMRIVEREEDFLELLESSRRGSLKSFNDQSVLLERYIVKPRHVEVQVFGDKHQNYVYLFERDCSVQRRHQKIIEEAPAPLLDERKRLELGEKAVAAARAVNYIGAGTVEFILDKETGDFYFMEMNTRLQVEHPITEMITNTDLVEWQLRVASGERLPRLQSEIGFSGHSFEARIYAEDPEDNFLPQTGELKYVCLPENTTLTHGTTWDRNQIRVDTGVTTGDAISPYYDPMISKLVVWDQDRQRALKKLHAALEQYVVVGVPTNIEFLISLSSNKSFEEADVGTDFIDLHQDELFKNLKKGSQINHENVVPEICAAIYSLISHKTSKYRSYDLNSFRIIKTKKPVYKFHIKPTNSSGHSYRVEYESCDQATGSISLFPISTTKGASDNATTEPIFNSPVAISEEDGLMRVDLGPTHGTHKFTVKCGPVTGSNETTIVLQNGLGQNKLVTVDYQSIFSSTPGDSESTNEDPMLSHAPMPGIIEKVLVGVGDKVTKGQSLMVLSAMKMEYMVKSRADGFVKELLYKPGDFVAKASTLLRLESDSG